MTDHGESTPDGSEPSRGTTGGPILNGTVSDLKQAEDLYAEDREVEALAVIEAILGLGAGGAQTEARLRSLLVSGGRLVEYRTKQIGAPEGFQGIELTEHLGPAAIPHLLTLRCKCFVALLDRSERRNDRPFLRTARENAELTMRLFPEEPAYLAFAAQVAFLSGDVTGAQALSDRASALKPDDQWVATVRTMIARGGEGQRFSAMTEEAISLVEGTVAEAQRSGNVDAAALDRAWKMLSDSLDIFRGQARAWAGLAWLSVITRQREQAAEMHRVAERLDSSDVLVRSLGAEIRKLGWLTEPAPTTASAGWVTAGGDERRGGSARQEIKPPLSPAWVLELDWWVCSGIVVAGFTAIFGDRGGRLIAVDWRTGRPLWERSLGGYLLGTPAVMGDRIYLGSAEVAFCLDVASGRDIWRRGGAGAGRAYGLVGCPLVTGGTVFFCHEGVVALDAETGEMITTVSAMFDGFPHAGACANDTHIFVPTPGRIQRLSRSSGRLEEQSIRAEGKVVAGPVVTDDLLIYGNNRSTVFGVSLSNLEYRWEFRLGGDPTFMTSRPAVANGRVFFGAPDGRVYALDAHTGGVVWATPFHDEVESPPLLSGDTVYVLASDGFHALSAVDGRPSWRFDAASAGGGKISAPAVAGNRILVGADRLQAFKPVA